MLTYQAIRGEWRKLMFTKRDLVQANLTTETANKHIGEKLDLVGIGIIEKLDKETEEVANFCAMKLADGTFITAISGTLCDAVDCLSDLIDEEGTVSVMIKESKSNSGRNYLTFVLV